MRSSGPWPETEINTASGDEAKGRKEERKEEEREEEGRRGGGGVVEVEGIAYIRGSLGSLDWLSWIRDSDWAGSDWSAGCHFCVRLECGLQHCVCEYKHYSLVRTDDFQINRR